MSEPVSNAEIEDVLSSIRRLVSEEVRPTPRAENPTPEDDAGKLVLTPAFRVQSHEGAVSETQPEDPATEAEPTLELPEAEEEQAFDAVLQEAMQSEEPLQELAQEEPASFELEQPEEVLAQDLSESDADMEPDWDMSEDLKAALQQVDVEPDVEPDAGPETDPEVDAETHDEMGAEVEAEPEFTAQPQVDTESEETTEVEDSTPWEDHTPEAEAAGIAEWSEAETIEADSGSALLLEDEIVEEGPAASELERTIAEFEAAVAVTAGEWEPDGSELTDMKTEIELDAAALNSEDTPAQTDDTAEPQETPHEDPDEILFAEDDGVIDEETLRDLVSDIVRQELQGALGERITRNVRKLVRREIHRALASRDFD